MLATFSERNLDEMLALTNGHLDHLAYVANYIRYHKPAERVTPKSVREALERLREEKNYSPPPPKYPEEGRRSAAR